MTQKTIHKMNKRILLITLNSAPYHFSDRFKTRFIDNLVKTKKQMEGS